MSEFLPGPKAASQEALRRRRVKEEGASESRPVTGRIKVDPSGNITFRETGPTSLWSFVTREAWPTDSGSKADRSAAATLAGAAPAILRDEVQPLVAHFLLQRSLELSHEKTSSTQIDDGFDFPGQNVRRYGTKLYFEERLAAQMANSLTGRGTARYLWVVQDGKGRVCSQPLTLEEGWHVHHLLWRAHGGGNDVDNLVLLHANCHRQVHREGWVVAKVASREGRS